MAYQWNEMFWCVQKMYQKVEKHGANGNLGAMELVGYCRLGSP